MTHNGRRLLADIERIEERLGRTSPGDNAFGGLLCDRASLLRHAQQDAHRQEHA